MTSSTSRRPRVLIICAHLRRDRRKRADRDFLQPLAGVHVGSCIDHDAYDVSLYHEMWHGPYDTASIVAGDWDLVFLSGLQQEFDRMRQLSYFFRRAGARVVAGGNICTLFPDFAATFFDAVCVGGVEAVYAVMRDFAAGALQPVYRARPRAPGDFPVAYHLLEKAGIDVPFHLIEASRGCSFACSFCVMPAEKNSFVAYGRNRTMAAIRDSIAAAGRNTLRRRWPMLWFMDNNFSDDRPYLLDLCAALAAAPEVKGWGALITQNVLRDHALIATMARSKCRTLFVGIESLDREFLKAMRKKQNLSRTQSVVDDVVNAERQGIVIVYSCLVDPRTARAADVGADLRATARDGRLPLPAFISYISPLVGTAFFWDCIAGNELRPNLRMRELDGETIAFANLRAPEAEMVELARLAFTQTSKLVPRRLVLLNVVKRMIAARRTDPFSWLLGVMTAWRIMSKSSDYDPQARRNYLGGEDKLDPQYHEYPDSISEGDRVRYFDPIVVTGPDGDIAPWLEAYRPIAQPSTTPRLAEAEPI